MGIFGSKKPKEPQIRVVKQGASGRVLDFSEFMNQEMKTRIRRGELEWMDKVDIFESYYIPKRESEGWVLIGGSYKSKNTDDRFKAEWQVGEEIIVGKYNDGESTVTERLKKKK
jgi:co-chaperonin GroES (HSP10)